MNKANYILIIVEGKSDEEALFAITEYNNYRNASVSGKPVPVIIPTNRDMLTALEDKEHGYRPYLEKDCISLIVRTIRSQLEKRCKEERIKVNQIAKAMYLTDMDGVFVDDRNIIQDKAITDKDDKEDDDIATYYMEKTILTPSRWKIVNRNWRKRENIKYILNNPSIELNTGGRKARVPLELFYMSCNLEHSTLNNRNYGYGKEHAAADWANDIAMKKDPEREIRSFFESLLPTKATYMDTWRYITEPKTSKSLERSSNWLLILDEFDHMAQVGR